MSRRPRRGKREWAKRSAKSLAVCAALGASGGVARGESARPRPVGRACRGGGYAVATGFDPKWRAPLDAVGIARPDSADAVTSPSRALKQIAFIDPGVPHFGRIVAAVGARAEIVVLNSARNAVAQMADRLRRESGVAAIHIFTHGDDGRLLLDGHTAMDAASLARAKRELDTIRASLAKGADVLVYGCRVAAGEEGRRFVDALAEATDADVAASTDPTGAALKGGDWDLEYRTGPVEAPGFALDEGFDAVLADLEVDTNSDSGADATIDGDLATDAADGGGLSLREAVYHANNTLSGPDTIRFAPALADGVIGLNASDPDNSFGASALAITSDVTIDGSDAPGLILYAGFIRRHFLVGSTGGLSLKNLTLYGGYAKGGDGGDYGGQSGGGGGAAGMGGAIFNAGDLAVEGCTFLTNVAQGGNAGVSGTGFAGGGGGGGLAGDGQTPGTYTGGDGGAPNGGVGGGPGSSGGIGGAGGGGGGGGFDFGIDAYAYGGSGGGGGFGAGGGGGGGAYGTGYCYFYQPYDPGPPPIPPIGPYGPYAYFGYPGGGGDGGFGGGGGGGGYGFCEYHGFGYNGQGGVGGFGGGDGDYFQGGGGAGMGGAIFNDGGIVSAKNSTFVSNFAYGGNGYTSGLGLGGGIFNRNGTSAILNCTFSENLAPDGGGAVYNLGDAAAATAQIDNTILADSVGGVSDLVDNAINAGTSTAAGAGNLIESHSGFDGTPASIADPALVALGDNGGPTETLALGASSPCLDAGDDAAASGLVTDQRGPGYARFDGTVDIGAFEEQVTPNVAPVAADDEGLGFETDWDAPFTTASVLTNDTDPDMGDTLAVKSFDTTGTLGLVTDNGDGTFDYDPNGAFDGLAAGASGTDTFTYTVEDNDGATDVGTVTITVVGPNTTPTAADDGGVGFETDWDAPFTTASVLGNDTDPDAGDTLSVVSINTTGTQGQVTNNGDGTFDYDPNGQFDGLAAGASDADTFEYTVEDNHGATDTAIVTITVNGPAPAPADDGGCTPGKGSAWTFLAMFGLVGGLVRMMGRAAARLRGSREPTRS